jgi:hypothetical protein
MGSSSSRSLRQAQWVCGGRPSSRAVEQTRNAQRGSQPAIFVPGPWYRGLFSASQCPTMFRPPPRPNWLDAVFARCNPGGTFGDGVMLLFGDKVLDLGVYVVEATQSSYEAR